MASSSPNTTNTLLFQRRVTKALEDAGDKLDYCDYEVPEEVGNLIIVYLQKNMDLLVFGELPDWWWTKEDYHS